MQVYGWRYYNYAAVPTTTPHETTDISSIIDGSIWKIKGAPLLARWTTDFDCGYETNWWYVIKDTPFNISELKAKRRYEIKKGIKNFEVKQIDPSEFKEELYRVQVAAFSAYPEKYRPTIGKDAFIKGIDNWKEHTVFGAFFRESNELCGYVLLSQNGERWVEFNVQKANPKYEKYALNAALVEKLLSHYQDFLTNGGVICDGARSINHETAFQDYLEKYFGFRKAYCKLHIAYNPRVKWLIKLLYPFRKILINLDGIGIIHQVNAVLRMEEICSNRERI